MTKANPAWKITRNPKLPISRPGVYSGIPLQLYHSANICAGVSVSSGGLRRAWSQSLAHFFDAWSGNPHRREETTSRAMILGAAAHHLLLGEDAFSLSYIGRPTELPDEWGEMKPWQGNRKVCRQWLAAQEAAGRTVVTQDELELIKAMAYRIAAHPIAADALRGLVEHSMFAKDKETGIWLRSRPDSIPTDSGDYFDLKVVSDISTPSIISSIDARGYHMQGALVWEVAKELGLPFETFSLIFIESERPHCIRIVTLKDELLSLGRRQNRQMLRAISECLKTGDWPGPGGEEIETMGASTAAMERITARLERMEGNSVEGAS